MTTNDSKPYLGCLNKLVDEYNNSYHYPIGKLPIDAEVTNVNASKSKFGDEVRITKYKNIFSKGYTENFYEKNYCWVNYKWVII